MLSSLIYKRHKKIQKESQKLAVNAIDKYYALEKVNKNKNNIIYVGSLLHIEILGLYHNLPAFRHPGHSHTVLPYTNVIGG